MAIPTMAVLWLYYGGYTMERSWSQADAEEELQRTLTQTLTLTLKQADAEEEL